MTLSKDEADGWETVVLDRWLLAFRLPPHLASAPSTYGDRVVFQATDPNACDRLDIIVRPLTPEDDHSHRGPVACAPGLWQRDYAALVAMEGWHATVCTVPELWEVAGWWGELGGFRYAASTGGVIGYLWVALRGEDVIAVLLRSAPEREHALGTLVARLLDSFTPILPVAVRARYPQIPTAALATDTGWRGKGAGMVRGRLLDWECAAISYFGVREADEYELTAILAILVDERLPVLASAEYIQWILKIPYRPLPGDWYITLERYRGEEIAVYGTVVGRESLRLRDGREIAAPLVVAEHIEMIGFAEGLSLGHMPGYMH